MIKQIFICDKCKSEFIVDNSLYNIEITNDDLRIFDSFDLCHSCFKELIKLIKEDSFVFTSEEINNLR